MSLYTDDDYCTLAERLTETQVAYEMLRGDARCAVRIIEAMVQPMNRDLQMIVYSILHAPCAFDITTKPPAQGESP